MLRLVIVSRFGPNVLIDVGPDILVGTDSGVLIRTDTANMLVGTVGGVLNRVGLSVLVGAGVRGDRLTDLLKAWCLCGHMIQCHDWSKIQGPGW